MDSPANITPPPTADLPLELRLRILALLPPDDLALAGRLAFKDAAQRFSQPPHRTARLVSRPLPGHVILTAWCVAGAQAALKHLTLQQRLMFLMRSPASGCEANVELAWRLVQPGLFPELLHTDHYQGVIYLPSEERAALGMGSAAIASGLAHLLPSLHQRCPGLLEPGRTLEAAALHCDLAGLQAVWGLVGQRVHTEDIQAYRGGQPHEEWEEQAWRCMAAAAARSPTHDAMAKVAWVLQTCCSLGRADGWVRHAEVCAAAAASGDLARLRWLRDHGFPWGTAEVLQGVMQQADFDVILQMEREGGYLPAVDHPAWTSQAVVWAALSTTKDELAKVSCLASRGVRLDELSAAEIATASQARERLARWLEQADMSELSAFLHKLRPNRKHLLLDCTLKQGSLPMLRRLVEAGFSLESPVAVELLSSWPAITPADSGRLVEAVQLLAGAGWLLVELGGDHDASESTLADCTAYVCRRHPWAVWRALVNAAPAAARGLLCRAVAMTAAGTGCEATLEALAELPAWEEDARNLAGDWYGGAAANGDLGTLTCLQRLGVQLDGRAFMKAVEMGAPLVALQWLVEQGAPVDRELLRREAESSLFGYLLSLRKGEGEAVRVWLRGLVGEGDTAWAEGGEGADEEGFAGGGQVQAHTARDAGREEEAEEGAAGGEGRAAGEAGGEAAAVEAAAGAEGRPAGGPGGEGAEEGAAAGGKGRAAGEAESEAAEEEDAAGGEGQTVGDVGRQGQTAVIVGVKDGRARADMD